MGKQTRRKNRKKGGLSKSSGSSRPAPAPPSKSSLVNRLRHGDLRIRHGALTAASATLFSPESLSRSTIAPITMELVQAMSERVMDDDAPCAMCALGCLGNYVLFQDQQYSKGMKSNRVETLLTPILLTKMKQACDKVENIAKKMVELEQENIKAETISVVDGTQSTVPEGDGKQKKKKKKDNVKTSPMDKHALSIMEQYSIQSLALHALCGIVESTATNNESSSILYHQKTQFLATILRSFSMGCEMIMALSSADSLMKKTIATKENQSNIISDVVSYTARTMHSACDDNPDLILALQSALEWKDIVSAVQNPTLPTLARLHCSAITITTRQMAPTPSEYLEQIVIQKSLPLLYQLTLYSSDIASALQKQVSDAHEELTQQKKDEKMENEIIRAVDRRKESARLIARRQKEMKIKRKEEEAKKAEMGEENDNIMVDGDGDTMAGEKEHKDEAKEEAEEKFDQAVNAWKNACLPLKLSVEIITNLCTIEISGASAVDDMDDMAWDSDQEEKLLDETQGNQLAFDISKEDQDFLKKVVAAGIPDRVLAVFGSVFMTLVQSGSSNQSIHPEVLEDLTDIISKCGICLGNMACNLQHSWKNNEKDVSSMWNEFRQCLVATKDENSSRNIPSSVVASILSIMGAFLRFRPGLVKLVNEQDLSLILSFVLMECPIGNSDEQNSIYDLQKDAIGILGILCSEPHPDEINEKICSAFLAVLNRSNVTTTNVMCEVLNALMDMYSSDEGDANNHENVFRAKGVLSSFQANVPILRNKIRADERNSRFSPEDIEFWKETALNAARFIKYKK